MKHIYLLLAFKDFKAKLLNPHQTKKRSGFLRLLIFCTVFCICGLANAQLVTQNGQGDLVYQTYANRGQTNSVNTVPDFSRAGYRGGGVPIPDVPVEVTVNPVAGDDGATIQAAINQVSAMSTQSNGFKGTVLLKAGTYEVEGNISITTSGVVLRGEGQGSTGGTKIIATGQSKRSLISISGTGSRLESAGTSVDITDNFLPVGSKDVNVSSSTGYNVGDDIVVERTPNQAWLNDMEFMGQWGWTPAAYIIQYERRIMAINGNTLTLDAPMVQTIEDQYGGGRVYKYTFPGRIANVGVENMRLESEFDTNDDETHGWNGVLIAGLKNGWVRKVTSQFFGFSCVQVKGVTGSDSANSKFITIEDCAQLDPKSQNTGGRKYSFVINATGGQYILFQRCYTRGGRHDYVTQRLVAGPNVFLDCIATETNSSIGPHQRYATGLMFDNVRGGEAEAKNRAGLGSGQGWAGAQVMYWNCQSTGADNNNNGNFNISSPTTGRNWGIGNLIGGNQQGNGLWQSSGTRVIPRSLYLAQLEERLGVTAVNNVTTPEQRTGEIWDQLKAWAGEGDPSNPPTGGIVSGTYLIENKQFGRRLKRSEIIENNVVHSIISSGGQVEWEVDVNGAFLTAKNNFNSANPNDTTFRFLKRSGMSNNAVSSCCITDDSTWEFIAAGNDYFRLKNKQTGEWLDADAADNNVKCNTDSTGDDKLWKFISVGGTPLTASLDSFAVDTLEVQNSGGVVIYPNPSSSIVYIHHGDMNHENINVSLFSLSGHLVQEYVTSGASHELNISNLKSGTYIVNITSEGKTVAKKLVVTN